MAALAFRPSPAQETGIPSTADVVSGWQFDQGALSILKTALGSRRDVDASAVRLIKQEITANTITRIWHFDWRKQRLKITESSSFTRAAREDAQIVISSISYTVRTDSGKAILEWSSKTSQGKTTQALIRPAGSGIAAEVIDSERGRSRKVFATLEAPYREMFQSSDLLSLRVGERDATVGYSIDAGGPQKYEGVVTAVNHKPEGDPAWVVSVETSTGDGSKMLCLIDRKKHMVRLLVGGMELVQCDPDVAMRERTGPAKTISLSTPVDCWVMPGRRLTSLLLRISPKNPGGVFTEQNARQTSSLAPGQTGQVIVRTRRERAPSLRELANAKVPAIAEIRDALKPAPDIESASPEMVKCARRIVGGETRPYQRGVLLARWVFRNVKATYDIASGSALQTLRSRRGDCTEDSVLFVALARSLRIPARCARGWKIVVDECVGHAWAEIFVGGRWIEIDPSTSELAGANYIRQKDSTVASLDSIHVDEIQCGDTAATVDRGRPYWTLKSRVYENRVLGLAMTVPDDAVVSFMVAGIPIPLPMTQGETPAGNVPTPLFVLTWPPAIGSGTEPSNTPQTSPGVAVAVSDAVNSAGLDQAVGGVFFGCRVESRFVVDSGGRRIDAFTFRAKDGVKGTGYVAPLNDQMSLTFVYTGALPSGEGLHTLPPPIAQMLSTVKLTKPDIGPEK